MACYRVKDSAMLGLLELQIDATAKVHICNVHIFHFECECFNFHHSWAPEYLNAEYPKSLYPAPKHCCYLIQPQNCWQQNLRLWELWQPIRTNCIIRHLNTAYCSQKQALYFRTNASHPLQGLRTCHILIISHLFSSFLSKTWKYLSPNPSAPKVPVIMSPGASVQLL